MCAFLTLLPFLLNTYHALPAAPAASGLTRHLLPSFLPAQHYCELLPRRAMPAFLRCLPSLNSLLPHGMVCISMRTIVLTWVLGIASCLSLCAPSCPGQRLSQALCEHCAYGCPHPAHLWPHPLQFSHPTVPPPFSASAGCCLGRLWLCSACYPAGFLLLPASVQTLCCLAARLLLMGRRPATLLVPSPARRVPTPGARHGCLPACLACHAVLPVFCLLPCSCLPPMPATSGMNAATLSPLVDISPQ